MQLRDQHVFITGGSSGIGLALGRRATAAGARLSILARDPARLAAARAQIATEFPQAPEIVTVRADVAVETEVRSALAEAQRVNGPVDVLVTSAGYARPGRFEEIPVEVFEHSMAVNYLGTLYPVKAVVPSMRQRQSGAIVIISSGTGLVGLFGYTAYAPSKFALRGLAESLRAELRPDGIQVLIAYPPDTDTPQLEQENRTKPAETRALTAAAGLWKADDVARLILGGLQRGKFTVTPGFQLTALAWLHSVSAPVLRWYFDRIVARARRKQ